MIILLILLLSAHLVCMQLASSMPLFCIWLARRESKQGDLLAGQAARKMSTASFLLFFIGTMLGVLLAWFMHLAGETNFMAALKNMPKDRVSYGIWELVFYIVVMGAYVGWWRFGGLKQAWQRGGHGLLALLAATNLLYHFPPFFVILNHKAADPQTLLVPMDGAEFKAKMFSEAVMYPTAHFWLASIIVCAVLIARWAGSQIKEDPESPAMGMIKTSARVALVATSLQLIIGIGVLFHLSNSSKGNLMGGDIAASLAMVIGIFTAFGLLHVLGTLSMGEISFKTTRKAVMYTLLIVLAMTATHLLGRGDDFRTAPSASLQEGGAEGALLD